jgi:hypothetical protein
VFYNIFLQILFSLQGRATHQRRAPDRVNAIVSNTPFANGVNDDGFPMVDCEIHASPNGSLGLDHMDSFIRSFCSADTPDDGAPVNGDGAPVNGDGVPANGAGAPVNGDGAPVNGDGAPVNGAGAPVNGAGAPVNCDGAPVNGDGVPVPVTGDSADIGDSLGGTDANGGVGNRIEKIPPIQAFSYSNAGVTISAPVGFGNGANGANCMSIITPVQAFSAGYNGCGNSVPSQGFFNAGVPPQGYINGDMNRPRSVQDGTQGSSISFAGNDGARLYVSIHIVSLMSTQYLI